MQIDRRGVLGGALAIAAAPATGWARSRDYGAAAAYSAQRRGVSFLVMQGGRVLFEDYPRSSAGATHELASGTKSFCGVLAAALVQDGLLSLDEACADTLTEWRDDPLGRAATIRTLLSLSSGVGGGSIGRPSTYAASVAQPFAGPSGVFRYGPAPFQVFGEIVRRKLATAGRSDDVLAFGPRADSHLLVVSQGHTARRTMANTKEMLAEMNVIGVVLNRSTEHNDSPYY